MSGECSSQRCTSLVEWLDFKKSHRTVPKYHLSLLDLFDELTCGSGPDIEPHTSFWNVDFTSRRILFLCIANHMVCRQEYFYALGVCLHHQLLRNRNLV